MCFSESADCGLIELEKLIIKPVYEQAFIRLRKLKYELAMIVEHDSAHGLDSFKEEARRLTVKHRLNERWVNSQTNLFWIKFKQVKTAILKEAEGAWIVKNNILKLEHENEHRVETSQLEHENEHGVEIIQLARKENSSELDTTSPGLSYGRGF